MTLFIFIRYLHFIGIFLIVGTLVSEHLLLKPAHSRGELGRLSRIDAIYGLGAVIVLVAGLIMWFGLGKPSEFYTKNWVFHLKVTLFTIVGILSIWPTVYFIKNRKGEPKKMIETPKYLKMIVRIELLLITIIPLLAVLMALGIGRF